MKKLVLILSTSLLLIGCQKEPRGELPPAGDETYQVSLNKTNSTLTNNDSTSPISLVLPIEGRTESYEIEIGDPCYAHSTYDEIVMKDGAYFKSTSSYHVDRLIIDFFGSKGTFFSVYSNSEGSGEAIEPHESSITPIDVEGGGKVLEYPIDSTSWMIKQDVNKPSFYSVTVVLYL